MNIINMQTIAIKTKLLLVLLGLLSVSSISAQRLGVRAGANLSNSKVELKGVDTKSNVGFNIGVISDFNLPFDGWKINTGLLFSNQGFALKQDYGNNSGLTYNFTTNTIEVPVNVRKEFNLLIVKQYIQAGLYSSYVLSGRVKDGDTSHSLDFKNNSDRFDTGFSVGIGSDLTKNIQILINYDHGFTKSEINFGDQVIASKNRRWGLSAGYMF